MNRFGGHSGSRRPDWRTYQHRLRRSDTRRRRLSTLARYGVAAGLIILFLWWMPARIRGSAVVDPEPEAATLAVPTSVETPLKAAAIQGFSRNERPAAAVREQDLLREPPEPVRDTLTAARQLINPRESRVSVEAHGRRLIIETSLDAHLQNFLLDRIDQDTSRYAGMVVMDPLDGRIIAMASHDKAEDGANLCTDHLFPAASVFKIVTAAAAVEACGMATETPLAFTGRKYTLYKSQIKKTPRRPAHTISLKDSFAQSINPVFGRIGAHFLGKELLETYAEAFGFNHDIPFDLPVAPSKITMTGDPYHLAEIASGFNRKTRISPLHGALIAAEAAYGTSPLRWPSMVDRIMDEAGSVVYERRRRNLNPVLSGEAVGQLRKMMMETIDSGTCRKYFKGYRDDPVLSRLVIGAKTGSINSRQHEGWRYDWFVGFAESKDHATRIVLSIVICHEKYIGIQSREFARMAIGEYFKNQFMSQGVRNAADKG